MNIRIIALILSLVCVTAHAEKAQTIVIDSSGKASMELTPAQQNKSQGDSFLAANKSKPGVVTLTDGLQYKILKEGNGAKPKATDQVKVHYAGRLINGTEFDSSYKRGEPISFALNQVIPGWTEALQLMPVGSAWEIYIPSQLAYGERGAPPVIGPNQALIFKVELLGINQ